MTPNELRRHLTLPSLEGDNRRMLLGALGSVAVVLGDDQIEAHGAWMDESMLEPELPTGVHIRLVVAAGVITLDYDFSFDGYPDARFLPWSRVFALRVIAEPGRQNVVANAWLETADQDIEFAGAGSSDRFSEIVRAVRTHLR